MKHCPKCGRQFDGEFDYCLDDGTPLNAGVPISGYAGFDSSHEVPTRHISWQPAPAPPPSSGNSIAKWLSLVIGMLVAVIAVGGYFAFMHKSGEQGSNKQVAVTASPSPTPKPASAAVPPTPATSWTTPPPAATPLPAPARPSVTTSRVKFAKDAVTASVSGSLSQGDVKNYLLACRAGQQLTATIASSDRCITFTDGSTVFRSYTTRGDNSLSVINRCSPGGNYRMEITIL